MACMSSSSTSSILLYGPRTKSSNLTSSTRGSFSTRRRVVVRAEKMSTTIDKLGIKIERNPPESTLTLLGVRKWPKWGCPPSKFPWTYDAKETCYLLEGKVKVYPDGANECVEIGAGDLVVFPKGMSCTWDVSVASKAASMTAVITSITSLTEQVFPLNECPPVFWKLAMQFRKSKLAVEEKMGKIGDNHTLILSLLLVVVVSVFIPFIFTSPKPKPRRSQLQQSVSTTEIFGVKIEKNPPPSKLAHLGVTSWPNFALEYAGQEEKSRIEDRLGYHGYQIIILIMWGCPPSKFPWTFTATETMYLLEGKVKVNVDGYDGSFEIGAGDLVVFPKGMKITWDVVESVSKHYSLEK
ncbi:hypothetical protein JRO89_XS07G0296600 [Xanthoceras sorbifolium]|uniref:(S)-ureidoglycine aminohydrolase cupin domain-containing protein n=1 Tax=Xanthoceras sorbifolium TaxID=99658 RepID=A0ABQ8HVP1_9ROSI|nr:hypothetical protein JRO89_XS07G0296600 [Xanthoceras sorbifolium]